MRRLRHAHRSEGNLQDVRLRFASTRYEGPVDADLDKPAMDDCESPQLDLGHRYRINQTTDVTTPLHEELKRMSNYFQPNRKQSGSGWAHGIGLRIASLGGKALIITLMTGTGSGLAAVALWSKQNATSEPIARPGSGITESRKIVDVWLPVELCEQVSARPESGAGLRRQGVAGAL